MKKLLLSFLFFSLSTIIVFATGSRDEDHLDNEIVELDSSKSKIDRSVNMVVCTIDRAVGTISVQYGGIGMPIINVYDSNGRLYSCYYGFTSSGTIIIELPYEEGVYQISVQSNVYLGVGTFAVY